MLNIRPVRVEITAFTPGKLTFARPGRTRLMTAKAAAT
jgi:hypothetical protein